MKKMNQPLVGARVVVVGQPAGGITDGSGKFIIKTKINPPFELLITYLGFDTLRTEVTSTRDQLVFG